MEIRCSKHAGFCTGVRRAVEMASDLAREEGEVYTLGSLVHNEEVEKYLSSQGIKAVSSPEEVEKGNLIIRTHGEGPDILEEVLNNPEIIHHDATCPRVRKVQRLAQELTEKGYQVVIWGKPDHPEVKGIVKWTGDKAIVASSIQALTRKNISSPAALIAQTTQEKKSFESAAQKFKSMVEDGEVHDTLCPAVVELQEEAEEMASQADLMIVIGSSESSNTEKLVKLCIRKTPTYRVGGGEDINKEMFSDINLVGVVAGASTPDWIIKEVLAKMEEIKNEEKEHTLDNADDLEQKEAESKESTDIMEQTEEAATQELASEETEVPVETAPAEAGEVVSEKEASADSAELKEEVSQAIDEEQTGEVAAKDSEDAALTREEVTEETASEEDAGVSEKETEEEKEEEIEGAPETAAKSGETLEDAEESDDASAATLAEPEDSGQETEKEEDLFDYPLEIKTFQEGEVATGVVVQVEEDSVMIDLGNKMEAMLPGGEVFLREGETLADKFPLNSELEVLIIKVKDEEGEILVSHRRLERMKLWERLREVLESGETIYGKVKNVVSAGIIVELGAGIEGFMPGSHVDVQYIPEFNKFQNQEVPFKVIEIDQEKEKVIVSRKKYIEEYNESKKEETLQNLQEETEINGVVRRLTKFGAFIDVGGIDGLVHVSEISWGRVNHPRDVLNEGDDVKVKILKVLPEEEKISLSIRQTQPDPWEEVTRKFKIGEITGGTVTRLVDFGAFVEIMPGVEGLVHVSQVADHHVTHPKEVLEEGAAVDVKILDLRPENKRISLSIKEAQNRAVDDANVSYNAENGSGVTLGDVFGDLFNNEKQ